MERSVELTAPETVVISNSPAPRAGHYGATVDSYRNVVRFNRGLASNDCPQAIGAKTTTLAMCGCCALHGDGDVLLRAVLDPRWRDVETVICTWYTPDREDVTKRLDALAEHKKVIRLDFGFCRRVERLVGVHNASSGVLVTCYYLEQLGHVDTLGFWGEPDPNSGSAKLIAKMAQERRWMREQPGIRFLETLEGTP